MSTDTRRGLGAPAAAYGRRSAPAKPRRCPLGEGEERWFLTLEVFSWHMGSPKHPCNTSSTIQANSSLIMFGWWMNEMGWTHERNILLRFRSNPSHQNSETDPSQDDHDV
uniref:Uncharacterized protein n=1 Tax=Oryza brachyantha TaxID=4533 RepID=J3M6F8_ORYBR